MKRLVLVAALWPPLAAAQTPPSPHDQAVGAQIMACVGDTLQVREQLATVQQQLIAAQAEIAKLKESTIPPRQQKE